ncbi:MAG: tetratricopeptide repeat protein [Acidiferrobacterales bacterium]
MLHKSLAISGSKDWSSQRKMVRRVRPDRRTSVRLAPDRRHGFGRREEDRAEAALLEKKLSAALTKAEAFGPTDSRLATALNELSALYYKLGKYTEVAPLQERCLAIRQKALRPTHAHVIQSLNDLARVYYAQGRYAATEPLVKQVMRVRERLHGSHDPKTAEALENYADILKIRGRQKDAAVISARAKSIRAKQG